jgi:hypothetical protein
MYAMYTVYTVYTHLHHLPVSKVMDIGKLLQPRRGMLLSPGFRGGRQIAWWIGAGLEPVHCPLHGSLQRCLLRILELGAMSAITLCFTMTKDSKRIKRY